MAFCRRGAVLVGHAEHRSGRRQTHLLAGRVGLVTEPARGAIAVGATLRSTEAPGADERVGAVVVEDARAAFGSTLGASGHGAQRCEGCQQSDPRDDEALVHRRLLVARRCARCAARVNARGTPTPRLTGCARSASSHCATLRESRIDGATRAQKLTVSDAPRGPTDAAKRVSDGALRNNTAPTTTPASPTAPATAPPISTPRY